MRELEVKVVMRLGMQFSIAKLVARGDFSDFDGWGFEVEAMVACLCHRLPIEFQTISGSAVQQRLVEAHMRLCVNFDPRDSSMLTVSTSEPILAEAAFVIMRRKRFDLLGALLWLLRGPLENKGDRGELVALILLLLARDDVIAKKNEAMLQKECILPSYLSDESDQYPRHLGEPSLCDWNRVLSVPEFLHALFGELGGVRADIDTLFKDTRMHFNHFVKVHEQELLRSQYLAGLLMRGAAVLCVDRPMPVDAAIPFSFQDAIDRWFIGHILVRVENDSKYGDDIVPELFDHIDPVALGITELEPGDTEPLPVVRIVFALASPRPAVKARKVPVYLEDGRSYWAIDIWCAGISASCLPIVESKDEEQWKEIIAYTQPWIGNYISPGEKSVKEYLWRMTPCRSKERRFWEFSPSILESESPVTQQTQ